MSKDMRRVIQDAQQRGWTVTRDRKHYVLDHASGRRVVVAATASDWRAILNARADIKRVERAAA